MTRIETSMPAQGRGRFEADAGSRMYRALLNVAHHGCPNSDVTRAFPDVRLKSISGARTEAAYKKQLLRIESDTSSIDEFTAQYRDHELVESLTVFPHSGTDQVAHLSTAIDYTELASVSSVLTEHGAYRGHSTIAVRGGEKWWLFFESHDVLSSIITELQSQGSDVDVLRKEEMNLSDHQNPQSPLNELTSRQREVFFVAVEHDYFSLDEDVTLEELAAELDLSTSSVWEHLSRAKEKILSSVASDAMSE